MLETTLDEAAHPNSSAAWLDYFCANLNREDALPWQRGVQLAQPAKWRAPLVRTLQRFHLGESGEGEWLKKWAADVRDGDYYLATEFFVGEEQAHSRWFGRLLDEIGAPRLESHWSDAIFTRVRHLGGLHFELITFLTAEIIGKRLFGHLARCEADALVCAVFARIVKDESAHIAFHVATLRAAFAGQNRLQRAFWRLGWQVLMVAALLLVCFDHAPLLRALGVSRLNFCRACWAHFRAVSGKIWRQTPRRTPLSALVWE